MQKGTRERGVAGEEAAARFLTSKGLKVVERQFQTRWGEVDLICRDGDTWVFVEVKSRASLSPLTAADAVTRAKQRRVVGAAISFMKKRGLIGENMRFDVVTLEADTMEWIDDAFEPPSIYRF